MDVARMSLGLAAFVLIVAYARVSGTRPHPLFGIPPLVLTLALPWIVRVPQSHIQLVAAMGALFIAVRLYELQRQRVVERSMHERLWTFVVWLVVPCSTRWVPRIEDARAVAHRGRRRALRGLLEVTIAAALLFVASRWPMIHANPWLEALWAMPLIRVVLGAAADLGGGMLMQLRIDVGETFDHPLVSASPREFWGRRWNLCVQQVIARNVFAPLRGRRRPVRATIASFLLSGLLHEYVVLAALGAPGRHTGWMLLFFAVQGGAVLVQHAIEQRFGAAARLPRSAAIALQLAWLTATSPLFFSAAGELFS